MDGRQKPGKFCCFPDPPSFSCSSAALASYSIKPHRAGGGPDLIPKVTHAPFPVVAPDRKRGWAHEGLALLARVPSIRFEASGFQRCRGSERVRVSSLPTAPAACSAQTRTTGFGECSEPQVESVGRRATGFLGAEHSPRYRHLVAAFLGHPALGAHEAIAEAGRAGFKAQGP